MNREKFERLIAFEKTMTNYISNICNLVWDDDADCIRRANNTILEWDDMEFIDFNNLIPFENDYIDGLLYFGDGTIEFHFKTTMEAENWARFDEKTLNNVTQELFIISLAR